MKKRIVFMLTLALCFVLCACSQKCSCDCVYCCDGETASATSDTTSVNKTNEAESTAEIEPVSAELAVEDLEITKFEGDQLWFKVKIRNISDADLEKISFQYQVLDENGDILCYQLCGAFNVVSGQAIWAGPYSVRDLNLEDVHGMSFASDVLGNNPRIKERVVFPVKDYLP